MSSNYPLGLEPSVCPWNANDREIEQEDWDKAVEYYQEHIYKLFDIPEKGSDDAYMTYKYIHARIAGLASDYAAQREKQEAEAQADIRAYDRFLDRER